MAAPQSRDQWRTRLGVIFAVAGSAVGIGNFLRFPGQAVANGGGVFMIPYLCALLLLGIPICWAEWTMGKFGGRHGRHSCPAILGLLGGPRWSYVGVFGLLMPTIVYLYYVVLESWCLAYAVHYFLGWVDLGTNPAEYAAKSGAFFTNLVGANTDGFMFEGGVHRSVWFWAFTFCANFFLVYRGIRRGIEVFCNVAMPAMVLCAVVVLVRVLTLPPVVEESGTRTVLDGLGFMWNPQPVASGQQGLAALASPQVWMAATGQMFFTLSVGFGVIMVYASYLKPKSDVLLSGLTASATNEFFEVCLGGLITIPAAFLFLGATGALGGTFSLGFNTLPVVFAHMEAGRFFGFIWFFMLFLAAITSSVSLIQPVIAFLEEAFELSRRTAVLVLGAITATGSGYVIYYSKGFAALDTLDFWSAQVGIFLFGTVEIIVLGWVFGARKARQVALDGTQLTPPTWVFTVLMRFITPAYLLVVFALWCWFNAPEYLKQVGRGGVPLASASVILGLMTLYLFLIHQAVRRWRLRTERGFPVRASSAEGAE